MPEAWLTIYVNIVESEEQPVAFQAIVYEVKDFEDRVRFVCNTANATSFDELFAELPRLVKHHLPLP